MTGVHRAAADASTLPLANELLEASPHPYSIGSDEPILSLFSQCR
jgi:hypothetical protein